MKTYYCVTSTWNNRGTGTAMITQSIKADKKPQNTYTSTLKRDIYNDWFGSKKEAEQFIRDSKNA